MDRKIEWIDYLTIIQFFLIKSSIFNQNDINPYEC